MKPILIVQHEAGVEPGNFATWAQATGRPYEVVRVDRGERLPASAAGFAGICSLGGNMSVNDDLPWIREELALIRDADARRVPVIGHCLGGQLIARALGAPVRRAEHMELGWSRVDVVDPALAREWLGHRPGDVGELEFFQWHGDAFDLPAGARRMLAGPLCANQAFVVQRDGFAHLGMQFHSEMTPELVRQWVEDPIGAREIDERVRDGSPGVQTADQMLRELEARTARMEVIARRLYERWGQGLRS
jgi:GMP synthase-like glutamine amidotransferase